MLKLSNEKMLKILIFVFFFFDKEMGNFLETRILGGNFVTKILGNIFEITFLELEDNKHEQLTLKVKKNKWENNILNTTILITAFNDFKALIKSNYREELITININDNIQTDEVCKEILKKKIIDTINLFISDNYNFENLKNLYNEIQIEEETLTIDFSNLMG